MAKMLSTPVPPGARSVSWPWYHHTLSNELTAPARALLEEYSKIPPQEVEDHVYRIRDRAWGLFPWPCIGEFLFLSLPLSHHPLYHPLILPRLASNCTLLDLGACMGQDLRKLIHDGAPAANLYACDLFPQYEALAYDLWRDDRAGGFPRGHFVADDVLADNEVWVRGGLMRRLGPGRMDIVVVNMFLHLFDWENQLRVATRILRLLAHRPGSMVVGCQAGVGWPVEEPLKPPFGKGGKGEVRTVFRHSEVSFVRLWEDAGAVSGVPLGPISCIFERAGDGEAGRKARRETGGEVGREGVDGKKGFTAEDLFSRCSEKLKKNDSTGPETGRLYFSIVRN